MARAQAAEASYDYDSAPKARENFPKAYMNVEFGTAEKRSDDGGRAYFYLEGTIVGPHADGTEDFDGHPVYVRWNMGTEDDPEAEENETWMPIDKKGLDEAARKRASGHDFGVINLISCLKAAKLTKAEGRGVAPWVLFPDLEGETLVVLFDTNKNGYQTYTWYEKGSREPMIVGRTSRPKREAATAPRAGNGHDADADAQPEEPRRTRR